MKKMERKENANKGFSLVELIVVVAIMAVLIGILAPQYLKYVEKTRVQKDESAAEEIRHAVEISMADENIYKGLTWDASNKITVTVVDGSDTYTVATETGSALATELKNVVGKVDFTSKTHNGQSYKVTATNTSGNISVVGEFVAAAPTP